MTSGKRTTDSAHQRSSDIRLELLSVLRSAETGIDRAIVWVSAGEFADAECQLGPRLLVVFGDSIYAGELKYAVTVRLTSPPDILGVLPPETTSRIETFVDTNRDALVRHWRGEIDTRETLDLLVRA